MLKRYSFFGMTLELIAVLGAFFVLFLLILIYAWWSSRKEGGPYAAPADRKGLRK